MPNLQEQINQATATLSADTQLLHDIVHGDETTVKSTENGAVKTVAKAIHDIENTITGSVNNWVQRAEDAATNAASSETQAANSASNALASKNNAASSASNAATSATNAAGSRTQAANSATAAATSAGAAQNASSNASASETNAQLSANKAAGSATTAASSASLAEASALRAEAAEGTLALPVGTILPFASNSIPSGFLLCDGSSIDSTLHPDLHNLFQVSEFTLAKFIQRDGYYVQTATIIDPITQTFGSGGFSVGGQGVLCKFSDGNSRTSWSDGVTLSSDDGVWGASVDGFNGNGSRPSSFTGFGNFNSGDSSANALYVNGTQYSGQIACIALLMDENSSADTALYPANINASLGSGKTSGLNWCQTQETAGHCVIYALPQTGVCAENIIGRSNSIGFGEYRHDLLMVDMASLSITNPVIWYVYYVDDVLKLAVKLVPYNGSAAALPDLRGTLLKGAVNPATLFETTNIGGSGSQPVTTINYIIKT